MKAPEDKYLAVAENHALIDASTITLMKLEHMYVIMVKVTRMNGPITIVIIEYWDDFLKDHFKNACGWEGAKDQESFRLQTSPGRSFLYCKGSSL